MDPVLFQMEVGLTEKTLDTNRRLKLIRIIETKRPLWDKSHPTYLDTNSKWSLWEEVRQEMQEGQFGFNFEGWFLSLKYLLLAISLCDKQILDICVFC